MNIEELLLQLEPLLTSIEDEDLNNAIKELIRLIKVNQFLLAYELASKIYSTNNIPEIKLVIDNLNTNISDINYIVDESVYKNEIVLNGYKKMEREVLVNLYLGDEVAANEILLKLAKLYIYQSPGPFTIYKTYLKSIADLKFNHTKINTRKYDSAIGKPLTVLSALLNVGDFIRAHDIIKLYEETIESDFDVAFEIFRLFDKELMNVLKTNTSNVYKQMSLNSNGINTVKEIVRNYDVSSISDSLIDEIDKKHDFSLDYDKNYYQEYVNHKDEGKYEEARNDIIKFQRLMGERGVFCDYDYLIQETDILLYNETYSTDEQKAKHKELMDQANSLIASKDYASAIDLLNESFKYEPKESVSTYSLIGKCYMDLGDYVNAAQTYNKEHREYMYPIDYLYAIEALYRIGEYEEIFALADGYEYYYPEESAFVHYILSLCYIYRGNYKLALDQIDTCEIISMQYYNLALNYNHERNIIKDLERGKDIEPYTLDDYYDHCFTVNTLRRIESLDIDSIPEDGSLMIKIINDSINERIEDKLDYLLKLSKVLKEMNRNKDAKELLKYIEQIIDESKLSPTDTEHFTLVLKNYRNL